MSQMPASLVLVGAGRMGGAMLRGWLSLGLDPRHVTVIDPHAASEIAAMRGGGFEATADFARIDEVDAIIICVPTPLSRHREPDLSFIVDTMKQVTPYLRAGQVLSLESTTWPGTTEEVLRPFAEERGLSMGEDFFLIFRLYGPERAFFEKTWKLPDVEETARPKGASTKRWGRARKTIATLLQRGRPSSMSSLRTQSRS